MRSSISTQLLLARYSCTINYSIPITIKIEETDILISALGTLATDKFSYIARPAPKDADWQIFYVKGNHEVGHLPSKGTDVSMYIKPLVKKIKALIT